MVKPFESAGLVLDDAPFEIAGHAYIQGPGATGHDVDPERKMMAIAHGRMVAWALCERTPCSGIAGDTAPGFLDFARNDRDSGFRDLTTTAFVVVIPT